MATTGSVKGATNIPPVEDRVSDHQTLILVFNQDHKWWRSASRLVAVSQGLSGVTLEGFKKRRRGKMVEEYDLGLTYHALLETMAVRHNSLCSR